MQSLSNPKSERRYDLDWLRVLAFSLLIFYHVGMLFVSWGWHIKNDNISHLMEVPMLFVNQWRMSLLFMISGAATFFAMNKLPSRKLIRERSKRIFLPLVFGMLVIVPPQIYIERLTQGHTYSYLEFYPSVFQFVSYPQGSLSWHHLWYLAYLMIYTLLFLPLFMGLKSPQGQRLTDRIGRWAGLSGLIFGFGLLQFVVEVTLRDAWEPTNNLTHDWYNHALYAGFFVGGFLLCTHSRCWDIMEQYRYFYLGLGLFTVLILYAFYWIHWPDARGWDLVLYRLIKSFNRWFWLLAILGFGKKYLSFNNAILKYANEAVYPFYILHQTIIIILAYPLISVNWPIGIKFVLLAVGTFVISGALYEFLIKRWVLTRVLFGLKSRSGASSVQILPQFR